MDIINKGIPQNTSNHEPRSQIEPARNLPHRALWLSTSDGEPNSRHFTSVEFLDTTGLEGAEALHADRAAAEGLI